MLNALSSSCVMMCLFLEKCVNAAKNIHTEKKANSAAEKNSGDDEKHLQKLRLSASQHDDEDDAK